jgi:hypothetical protein
MTTKDKYTYTDLTKSFTTALEDVRETAMKLLAEGAKSPKAFREEIAASGVIHDFAMLSGWAHESDLHYGFDALVNEDPKFVWGTRQRETAMAYLGGIVAFVDGVRVGCVHAWSNERKVVTS